MDHLNENTRCGFVSVLGLPNAGKSTLVNALVGEKVSIVSRKVQTTRARVLGIVLHDEAQILLMDTPGVFKAKKTMEKAMVDAALATLQEADAVLHIVDASKRGALEENKALIERLGGRKDVILALNKIDRLRREDLLAITQEFNAAFPYQATFMISALEGSGLQELLKDLSARMPEGPWHYPEDQITDMPMRMLAAEITREKIFDMLHQELPYEIFVETESWEHFDNGDTKISQVVYVSKEGHKGIVLGKGGSRIKEIGKSARRELEELTGGTVHLKLFVKVKENWNENAENYRLFGLNIE